MLRKNKLRLLTLPALLSLALLAGCWSATAPLSVAVPPPPLPQQARQPAPPPLCNPTCSAGLETLLDSLLPMLTGPGLRVKPAVAATTQP